MQHLKIAYPSLDQYPSVIDLCFPRHSPELQALPPTSETPLYASIGTDSRSWTLGKGWSSLETLKLAGLSQNGVGGCLGCADDRPKPFRPSYRSLLRPLLKKAIPGLSRLIYRPISSIMACCRQLASTDLLVRSSTSLSLPPGRG